MLAMEEIDFEKALKAAFQSLFFANHGPACQQTPAPNHVYSANKVSVSIRSSFPSILLMNLLLSLVWSLPFFCLPLSPPMPNPVDAPQGVLVRTWRF